jgi:hypothetical protein
MDYSMYNDLREKLCNDKYSEVQYNGGGDYKVDVSLDKEEITVIWNDRNNLIKTIVENHATDSVENPTLGELGIV